MTNDDVTRYFVVNVGRCGSTLLSAILADAGAEFGIPIPERWSESTGALEHSVIQECSRLFRRADYIAPGKRYFPFYKYLADARRSVAKRKIARVLREVRFAKATDMTLWIWHVSKMGYRPRIILSYRGFAANAISYYLLRGLDFTRFAAYYRRVNMNGLLMVHTYGGCAISYEELIDPDEVSWAEALSGTTGFDRDRLLEARANRLSERSFEPRTLPSLVHDVDAEEVYRCLGELKGVAVPPSPQFLRLPEIT